MTETCDNEDEDMETIEQYNQESQLLPVIAGMTEAVDLGPSKTLGIPSYLVPQPLQPGGG